MGSTYGALLSLKLPASLTILPHICQVQDELRRLHEEKSDAHAQLSNCHEDSGAEMSQLRIQLSQASAELAEMKEQALKARASLGASHQADVCGDRWQQQAVLSAKIAGYNSHY